MLITERSLQILPKIIILNHFFGLLHQKSKQNRSKPASIISKTTQLITYRSLLTRYPPATLNNNVTIQREIKGTLSLSVTQDIERSAISSSLSIFLGDFK